ncbi:hypothetical protein ACFO0S_12535 [Chryseomicrobium palamuruense]|uniref:DUF4367 domain-containing protein n=1 Tax=Chryseomicrobium palamuruense TaxID=682973 RepID=A0ABV8UZA8_9BACL
MLKRRWQSFLAPVAALFLLTACSSPEEQAAEGVRAAVEHIENEPESPNEKVGEQSIFLPSGFSVEAGSEAPNFLLQKGNDTYVLFINENEPATSRLYYDLLVSDPSKTIIEEQTNELSDQFAFAAVVKHAKDQFELIVSRGGVKLSTVTDDSRINQKLQDMMTIVHSYQTEEDTP